MGNRVLVAVLAAVDAAVTAVVGVAAVAAPLTVLWVFGFGDRAQWAALWPATARVWELGHLVPVALALPSDYAATAGVAADAAAFTVSLAPLALAAFTAIAAARSGARAAAAGAAATGALTGTVVFAAAAAAVAFTSANPVAAVPLGWAVLLPAAVFGVPAGAGAVAGAWRLGEEGPFRGVMDRLGPTWRAAPGAVGRGAAIVVAGLVAAGALTVVVLVAVRGGQVIALFEATRVDVLGATVVTLGQLAYLPTLVVWAIAYLAGPGVVLGATTIAPAVTGSGVVPGIPVLGIIPALDTPWLLLLTLLPIALGALAGLRARRDLGPALPARCAVAAGIAVAVGGVGALVALAASGSIGPGMLAAAGPDPVAVGLALGVETLVGAAVTLLAPARGGGAAPAVEQDERLRELVDAAGPARSRL